MFPAGKLLRCSPTEEVQQLFYILLHSFPFSAHWRLKRFGKGRGLTGVPLPFFLIIVLQTHQQVKRATPRLAAKRKRHVSWLSLDCAFCSTRPRTGRVWPTRSSCDSLPISRCWENFWTAAVSQSAARLRSACCWCSLHVGMTLISIH